MSAIISFTVSAEPLPIFRCPGLPFLPDDLISKWRPVLCSTKRVRALAGERGAGIPDDPAGRQAKNVTPRWRSRQHMTICSPHSTRAT